MGPIREIKCSGIYINDYTVHYKYSHYVPNDFFSEFEKVKQLKILTDTRSEDCSANNCSSSNDLDKAAGSCSLTKYNLESLGDLQKHQMLPFMKEKADAHFISFKYWSV